MVSIAKNIGLNKSIKTRWSWFSSSIKQISRKLSNVTTLNGLMYDTRGSSSYTNASPMLS